MTNTTSSTPTSVPHKILSSPMRDAVRAVMFFNLGGEGSIAEIRRAVAFAMEAEHMPRLWKALIRDVLTHDPEIEKTEENTWVLCIPDADET